MNIDMGNNSGSGTDLYFGWAQKPGVNFNHSQVFYINLSGQPKEVVDVSQGLVLDTTELRTGWQDSETNKWQFNASVSQMQPKPGDGWKKGFAMPLAVGAGKVAMWMASGASAWDMLGYLGPQLSQCPEVGQVPLVMYEGPAEGRYENRTWVYPKLKVQSWMPRPESLSKRNAIDLGTPAPVSAMPAPPAPGMMPPATPAQALPPMPASIPPAPAAPATGTTYF